MRVPPPPPGPRKYNRRPPKRPPGPTRIGWEYPPVPRTSLEPDAPLYRLNLYSGLAEPVYRLSIGHFRCLARASGVGTTQLNHQGDASPHRGGRARAEWSGHSECESAAAGQVVIGRHWRQRGSRHRSAWCDLRRRQFRRARTSRRCGRAAGHRADGHDNDTSARAGDQRGDPERDRDHAIGLHAGYQAVVAAGSTRRTALCPVTLRLVHRYCGACGVLVTVTMVGMAATAVARLGAFDPLTEGIRNLHDSGNPANMRTPLATLAALLDRLGRYEPAARIAGFALSPPTSTSVGSPKSPPRSPTCGMPSATRPTNRLARKVDGMTTAAIATCAYDQIDQAPNRTERRLELDLERVSNFGSAMARRYAGHC